MIGKHYFYTPPIRPPDPDQFDQQNLQRKLFDASQNILSGDKYYFLLLM